MMKINLTCFVAMVFLHSFFSFPEVVRADSSYTGPLFDAHAHINHPSTALGGQAFKQGQGGGRFPGGGQGRPGGGFTGGGQRRLGSGSTEDSETSLEHLVDRLREAGLSGVFLYGTPDATVGEQRKNPNFVYPFVPVAVNQQTKQVQFNDQRARMIEQQLSAGMMYGIGEIPLRHQPTGEGTPADDPRMLEVYDFAAAHHIPVNVHVEYEYSKELERALAHNPSTTVVWAHVGTGPASLARELMRKYPNLYADISIRNPIFKMMVSVEQRSLTDSSGRLKAEWKALFEEFPDRFLFGTDINNAGRLEQLDQLVAYYRSVLGQLTPGTAEKIAYKNAQKLLKEVQGSLGEGGNALTAVAPVQNRQRGSFQGRQPGRKMESSTELPSDVEWIKVSTSEGRTLVAAVDRPKGTGPFPVVVILHGAEGFRPHYVQLASKFAESGFVAVAGAWFTGSYAQKGSLSFQDVIACPDCPEFQGAGQGALKYILALIDAARKLPDVRPDRVGLFGHSAGAVMAVLTASSGGNVQAVVADGAGYQSAMQLAGNLEAPILILHGTADNQASVAMAQEYEQTLRQLGKTVETHYFEGASHQMTFRPPTDFEIQSLAIAFFRSHLLSDSAPASSPVPASSSDRGAPRFMLAWLGVGKDDAGEKPELFRKEVRYEI